SGPHPGGAGLPTAPGPPDDSHAPAPADSGLARPPASSAPGSTAPSSPAPSGAAARSPGGGDRTAGAFRSVREGQCLNVHSNGDGWSRAAPTAGARVRCGSDRAYVRVADIRTSRASCPKGNGRGSWSYTPRGGRATALCLTRHYRVGQCLAAEKSKDGMLAALMSAPACGGSPPASYNRLLRITSIHGLAAGGGSDDVQGRCARDAKDDRRYWTWRVDGGRYLLCARESRG
ncbi:LppU/SCO3897 family protein, partial [Streptomyces boncukensis]|nr:hypothetical protein [Streptomyces boncukensis]